MSIATALTALNEDITAARTAITTKGGTVTEGGGSSQLATDIATIPTGGGGGGWERPEEWGPQDPAFVAEKALPKEQRTMEAIYMTYHHDDAAGPYANFAGFAITTSAGTYTVTRGHVENGSWVNDAVTSGLTSGAKFFENFYGDGTVIEYPVYKVTPDTQGATMTSGWKVINDPTLSGLQQPIVEVYGRTDGRSIKSKREWEDKTISIDMMYYVGLETNINGIFDSCTSVMSIEIDFESSAVTDTQNMFKDRKALKQVNIKNFNTSAVTNMQNMFQNCYSLTQIDVSGWDTSAVTNMQNMFGSCYSLTQLDVSGWDTSAVTNMSYMFQYCYSLTQLDVSGWDTSAVTNMQNMFGSCHSLTQLDVSGWDTSAVTNMQNMFYMCYCLSAIDLSSFNTTNVTNMEGLFSYCSRTTFVDISGFDMANVEKTNNMFFLISVVQLNSCSFYKSVVLNSTNKLTHDSLMSIINNLATVSTTQTLTIGATNRAKLTAEEIAIATGKGWTVA